MIYTLPEVKKALKKQQVTNISVSAEAYANGFDVSIDVWFMYGSFDSFCMSEEETLSNAKRRIANIVKSLRAQGYKVENKGVMGC